MQRKEETKTKERKVSVNLVLYINDKKEKLIRIKGTMEGGRLVATLLLIILRILGCLYNRVDT